MPNDWEQILKKGLHSKLEQIIIEAEAKLRAEQKEARKRVSRTPPRNGKNVVINI